MEKDIEYTIKRSRRMGVGVYIDQDGNLIVRAPFGVSEEELRKFVYEKRAWIEKHRKMVLERKEAAEKLPPLTMEDVNQLAEQARVYFPPKVKEYAQRMGVTYGRITIRNQKTRWGSCSEAGNLNFNCLLMLLSEEVREYLIVHELCHRIHMDHSTAFWNEVAKYCPNYKELEKELKVQGGIQMRRIIR